MIYVLVAGCSSNSKNELVQKEYEIKEKEKEQFIGFLNDLMDTNLLHAIKNSSDSFLCIGIDYFYNHSMTLMIKKTSLSTQVKYKYSSTSDFYTLPDSIDLLNTSDFAEQGYFLTTYYPIEFYDRVISKIKTISPARRSKKMDNYLTRVPIIYLHKDSLDEFLYFDQRETQGLIEYFVEQFDLPVSVSKIIGPTGERL